MAVRAIHHGRGGGCLIVGFLGWVFQGHAEDAGQHHTQSWPLGVGGFATAGVLVLVGIRNARPNWRTGQLVVAAVAISTALVLVAPWLTRWQ